MKVEKQNFNYSDLITLLFEVNYFHRRRGRPKMFFKSIKHSLHHPPHQMSLQKNRTTQTNRIKESDNSRITHTILKGAGEINYNNIASNNSNQTNYIFNKDTTNNNNNNNTKNSRKMSRTYANANKISKISKIKTNYLNKTVNRLANLKKKQKN